MELAARHIAHVLRSAGFAAWFVGGCVRDRLLGLPPKDFDVATDARPEAVAALFPRTHFVGARFGVCRVLVGEDAIEVATFRRDGLYLNHRHPDSVSFGSLEDDARRRDFTINSLFENPESGEILDFHGGRADLAAKILRCVGDPEVRFREDALRLLRAVRFAARFDLTIEPATWSALCNLAPLIEHISPERQRDELTGCFTGPAPGRALAILEKGHLLDFVLPEVAALQGVAQPPDWHPEGDVLNHTALVMDFIDRRTMRTAWGALLHDVGKPPTFAFDEENNRITFYEHQKVGAEMARTILSRLRFSNEDTEAIASLVLRHMDFMNVKAMRAGTLRRFLGAPGIDDDLTLHRADCLGSHGLLDHFEFAKGRLEELRNAPQPIIPKPLLNGHELMASGMKPGPEVGIVLHDLMEAQLAGDVTTREEALEWFRKRTNSA